LTAAAGSVMTVRGPVEPETIGATSMHDHVFSDARAAWWAPESFEEPDLTDRPLDYRNAGLARWNALGIRDNLYLGVEDYLDQVGEVAHFKAAGGGCLVDLTNVGISPSPVTLRKLALELDLHIVCGSGFYVHPTHPEWLERADVDEIATAIRGQIRNGVDGDGIRPGIVGEIGTSGVFHECEQRVVRAAARAAAETGLPMNVHTTATAMHALRIVELVVEEGLDPRRLIFSHLDEVLDRAYHREVLQSGAVIGFDSFGCDVYFARLWKSPSDMEKIAGLLVDLELGYEDQLVLGHDISLKCQLKRYAGLGYDHILRRIVPSLIEHHGVDREVADKLLILNPRRLLTILDG
jgi:phosphotriesterase-related protein